MNRALSWIRALLFPPKCVCCRELLPFDTTLPLCNTCAKEWEIERVEACGFCQKPVCKCTCSTPQMKNAGVSVLFKLAYYKAGKNTCPDKILFRMKDSASERLYSFLAKPLSEEILSYLREKEISLSTCVLTFAPRQKQALARAGVDQAECLAKALFRETGIKSSSLLERKRSNNQVQKKLNATERQKNAKATFAIKKGIDLAGKTILLVDDTVTTGATMGVCAKLLKDAGAKKVFGVALTLDEIGRYPKEEALSTKPYS